MPAGNLDQVQAYLLPVSGSLSLRPSPCLCPRTPHHTGNQSGLHLEVLRNDDVATNGFLELWTETGPQDEEAGLWTLGPKLLLKDESDALGRHHLRLG